MHAAHSSETNEYGVLAGKELGKYLLGKYARNESAGSYELGCVEADYKNSGEQPCRGCCRIDECKVNLSTRTDVWDKTTTSVVTAYTYQRDSIPAILNAAFYVQAGEQNDFCQFSGPNVCDKTQYT